MRLHRYAGRPARGVVALCVVVTLLGCSGPKQMVLQEGTVTLATGAAWVAPPRDLWEEGDRGDPLAGLEDEIIREKVAQRLDRHDLFTSIAADGATPRDDIRYVIEIDVLEYHRGSRDVRLLNALAPLLSIPFGSGSTRLRACLRLRDREGGFVEHAAIFSDEATSVFDSDRGPISHIADRFAAQLQARSAPR